MRLSKSNGFGMIEIIVSAGIMGIFMMGVLSLSSIVLKSQSQSNLTFQADSARRSIVSALNSAKSWKATVMDAANNRTNGPMLDCIPTYAPGPSQAGYVCTTNGVSDVAAGGAPITARPIGKITDAAGAPIYDGTQPNFGLSAQGTTCTNFVDPATGPGNDS